MTLRSKDYLFSLAIIVAVIIFLTTGIVAGILFSIIVGLFIWMNKDFIAINDFEFSLDEENIKIKIKSKANREILIVVSKNNFYKWLVKNSLHLNLTKDEWFEQEDIKQYITMYLND